jgi:hypothetical protein
VIEKQSLRMRRAGAVGSIILPLSGPGSADFAQTDSRSAVLDMMSHSEEP